MLLLLLYPRFYVFFLEKLHSSSFPLEKGSNFKHFFIAQFKQAVNVFTLNIFILRIHNFLLKDLFRIFITYKKTQICFSITTIIVVYLCYVLGHDKCTKVIKTTSPYDFPFRVKTWIIIERKSFHLFIIIFYLPYSFCSVSCIYCLGVMYHLLPLYVLLHIR